jgi:hypothetical protein
MCDIGMIKGVLLAWKLCCKWLKVCSVVILSGISVGLGVNQREEGEETVNIKHTDVAQCMTR